MMSKPYPKYKPSGVEWLGDVPEHWGVKRLKTSVNYWVSNVNKVPDENELPVRLCNYTDVYYNDFVSSEMELMETTATIEEIRKFHLEVDDVIITKDSEEWNDIAISALVTKTEPNMVCGYHLAMIRPNKDKLIGKYLARQFQSSAINHQFQLAATGVTRYGLPKSAIGEAIIPLPPLPEQQAIASFLDRETGRIEPLIGKKQRLLQLLAEQRTALISRAVTKGLDAMVKLKPSGVEWLGDVPEHWHIWKLAHLTTRIGSGKTPTGGADVYQTEGVTFLRSQNVYDGGLHLDDVVYIDEKIDDEMAWSRVKPNDILLNITGASLGRTCITPNDMDRANVNQHVCVIRLTKVKYSAFIAQYLKSRPAKSFYDFVQTGSAREGLNFEQIGAFPIPLPPLPEQQAIAAYLDCEIAKIDTLSAKVFTVIERLKEYRTALISSAVTGKIDVREAV